jgi:hypothetical protein
MIAWPASRARLPPATLSIGALPADRESRRRPYRGQNGNSSTVDLVVRVMKEVIALASAVLLAACTSSGPDRSLPPVESTPVPTPTTGASTHGREDASVLVRAHGSFLETCRETARMVGYPVPCPSKILAGGTPPPEGSTCRIDLIGAGVSVDVHTPGGAGSRLYAKPISTILCSRLHPNRFAHSPG